MTYKPLSGRISTSATVPLLGVLLFFALLSIYAPHAGAQQTDPQDTGSQGTATQSSSPSEPTAAEAAFGSAPDSSTSATSTDNDPAQRPVSGQGAAAQLPAEQIIQILQENPDLMLDVKSQFAQRMQQQGMQVDAASVSDETVYNQITEDPNARMAVSQYLQTRGYTPAQGSEPFSSSAQTPGLPDSSTMPLPAGSNTAAGVMATGVALPNAGVQRRDPEHPRPGPPDRFETSTATRTNEQDNTSGPRVVHQKPPYDLQALRDLYAQLPGQNAPLKRFGSDMFTNRATSRLATGVASSDARLDVPLGPDYVLAPGDTLKVDLWGGVTQSFAREISSSGSILLPEAGEIQIAGLPLARAEGLIRSALGAQYRGAQVAITLSRLHSVRVYVTGDVQRPGGYDISSLSTPLSALYAAGGPTSTGSLRILRHLRGNQLIQEIDLYDFLLHGMQNNPARFQTGDTLQVPPSGPQISISGAVKRPAIYELKPGQNTLASVLDDAGGAKVTASLGHITIERVDPNRGRLTVTVTDTDGQDPKADQAALAAFTVQDGDNVHISPILPYSQRAVYLQGHVTRPGKLPYSEGMRLSDVLRSYRDLLPEPAPQGELIRLAAPDYHVETIPFNVPGVLVGNSNLALQPFDTVRIFGRYEVDTPSVTLRGEVLRPGTYPLSEGMTAADLVRMAGGFKRDAMVAEADLTSYQVEDGTHIDHQLTSIAIGSAMDHTNPSADVALKPGDILTIHQLTGWGEIGQSITILGQVQYAGSYGFREGERLSSVLRRAGGMRDTAYPEGAVLTREQVRDLEEKSRQELIRQIETNSSAARLGPALGGGDTGGTLQLIKAQQEEALAQLKSHPSTGRMVIHISADINSWANTPADVELRRGDVLTIPKRPGFVLVTGQVYNATALTFAPGKTAEWYLGRAGGTNGTADRKEIFIIRANGSVVGRHSGGWFSADVLSSRLDPGDVVVVPQKIIGASLLWRNLLATAQVFSSIGITAGIAAAAL